MPSLGKLRDITKEICSIATDNTTYDSFIERQINDGQDDFATETNWKYLETRGSLTSSTFQFKYTLTSDHDIVKAVIWEHDHYLRPVNHDKWIRLNLSHSTGTPRYYIVLGGSLCLYPYPNKAGGEGYLNGIMSATGNDSIILSSTGNFEPSGRVLIGSEVIEYSYTDSLRMKPLIRGVESTTPATHLVGAVVYARNIEYDYYKILSDLTDSAHVSEIPKQYHRVLPIYAAAQFFYKTENETQGNKFMEQYLLIRNQAKRDLAEKQTQSFSSTLDDEQQFTERELDNTIPPEGSLSTS